MSWFSKPEPRAMNRATADLADVLMKYGYSPTDAIKESNSFWNNRKDRLRQVM
jgi:hypothetical protein